jgi:hypothetical protein
MILGETKTHKECLGKGENHESKKEPIVISVYSIMDFTRTIFIYTQYLTIDFRTFLT